MSPRCVSAVLLFACSACGNSEPTAGPLEEKAARLFGLPITQIHTAGAHGRVEDCGGEQALVLPPRASVEVPVTRGFHTLSGRFAICDLVGAAPVEFRVEFLAQPTRVLFGQLAAVPAFPWRDSYPFMLTFWAERDSSLLLHTLGDKPDVKSAWLDLTLTSVERPTTGPRGVEPEANQPSPQISKTSTDFLKPGLRSRQTPLRVNPVGAYWLSDWGWSASATSWGPIEIDAANGTEQPGDGPPLSMGGRVYGKGIGMHAPGRIVVDLQGLCRRFYADVGIDDKVGKAGSARFIVSVDGEIAFHSDVLRGGDGPVRVDIPLHGRKLMLLTVNGADDGPENDWTNWGDAQLFCDAP